jgi:Protein of unknown function (DUF2914)
MKRLLAVGVMLGSLLPALAPAQNLVTEIRTGKGVVDRNITEETTTFARGEKAYLWLRAEGGVGETVTVTWKVNDQSYPVELKIGGSPWRTWASKTLHVAGTWTVTVTDAAGATLNESIITVE